jgi:hypothetical protein
MVDWTSNDWVLLLGSIFAGITGLFVAVRMSKCVKVTCCGNCLVIERDPVKVSRQESDRELRDEDLTQVPQAQGSTSECIV